MTLSRAPKFWTWGATTSKSSETTVLFRFSNRISSTDITFGNVPLWCLHALTILLILITLLLMMMIDDNDDDSFWYLHLAVQRIVTTGQFWTVTLFQLEITNLQKIFVQYCKIRLVQPKAFRKLTNLVELDLGENLLQVGNDNHIFFSMAAIYLTKNRKYWFYQINNQSSGGQMVFHWSVITWGWSNHVSSSLWSNVSKIISWSD